MTIEKKFQYTFTVFTCTYNRANTLARTFESLKNQTFRDFEWIVFDNGSTDNTADLIKEFVADANFDMRVMSWEENTGVQNTFNEGIKAAKGKFWLLLDSDDACLPHALEKFVEIWQGIPEHEQDKYAGVTVNCVDQHGSLVGKEFPKSPLDSTYVEMMYKYRKTGEKWGFNRTSVLLENPFPTSKEHLSHGLAWRTIGKKYLTRYVNETLRIYFINEPGRNDQWTHHHLVSPHTAVSRRTTSKTAIEEDLGYFKNAPYLIFKQAIVYTWFSTYLSIGFLQSVKDLKTIPAKILATLAYPAGRIMHWRSSKRTD